MVGQALTGKRQSIPKVATIKAHDGKKIVFKNMGNNHSDPMFWADIISFSNNSTAIVASGVVFNGKDLATYGNIVATPQAEVVANYYIDRDIVNNVVSLKTAGAVAITADFNVQIFIGDNSSTRYIEEY